jgi:hypothetical protein
VNNNTHREDDEISKIFNDVDTVRAAMQAGIDAALLRHKKLGYPICVWRNDQVEWIAPEDINIDSQD